MMFQPPGLADRIDTRLPASNRHRPFWHSDPRGGAPRRGDLRVDLRQVGKSRKETDHVDPVVAARVTLHHFRLGASRKCGDVRKIRSELPAVTHRHLDGRADGRGVDVETFGARVDLVLDPPCVDGQRIEIHGYRHEADDNIPDGSAEARGQAPTKRDTPCVQLGIDALGQFDDERRVTCRQDPERRHHRWRSSAVRSF